MGASAGGLDRGGAHHGAASGPPPEAHTARDLAAAVGPDAAGLPPPAAGTSSVIGAGRPIVDYVVSSTRATPVSSGVRPAPSTRSVHPSRVSYQRRAAVP